MAAWHTGQLGSLMSTYLQQDATAATQDKEVMASEKWTPVEDYVNVKAMYQLHCPPDRWCVAGGGLMLIAKCAPGRLVRWSGTTEVQVIGTGSLRVRVDDDRGPCCVRVVRIANETIVPFPEV